MFEPIAKRTNSRPAVRFSAEIARQLRDDCDDVAVFAEAGWTYAMGFKGEKTVVLAYGSREDYERMMNPSDNDIESGYGYRR